MEFDNLHQILRSLYEQMMSLCRDMAGVAKGIAGLGALFYVAYRVWQSLARAEPIDVLPMLRSFAIDLYIMFFPTVISGTMNNILSPVVQDTAGVLEAETLDMSRYREQKDKLEHEAMVRNPETTYLVSNEEFDKQLEELGWSSPDMVTMAGIYIDRGMYNMKKSIRDFFHEVLELLFQAAALVIDTVRTFLLVVLAILGPIAFTISVWDGFQSMSTQWICRYIQVYLWSPVSDMFSTILVEIQVLMLQSGTEWIQTDPNFLLDSSDGVHVAFLCIGIIGYFTIPTVAGWVIQTGGMGGYGRNVNQMAGRAGGMAGSVAGAVIGNMMGCADKLLKQQSCRIIETELRVEFKSLGNIEPSFRQIRLFGIVFLLLCVVVTIWNVWNSCRFAEKQREKIYALDNGKSLILALSQDLSQSHPVEAREHVRHLHELFFTLSFEKSAIEYNVKRALLPVGKSVYHYYSDFVKKGYYNRIIARSISQVPKVDSVVCDFNAYPYRAATYATQKIIRQSNVTERSLVTTCRLLNASWSDGNPSGFTIEDFTIIEDKDSQTIKR